MTISKSSIATRMGRSTQLNGRLAGLTWIAIYTIAGHDSRFCCKRGYAAVTGSLAIQPFDILHEYASGLHASECPSRFASARFRDDPS